MGEQQRTLRMPVIICNGENSRQLDESREWHMVYGDETSLLDLIWSLTAHMRIRITLDHLTFDWIGILETLTTNVATNLSTLCVCVLIVPFPMRIALLLVLLFRRFIELSYETPKIPWIDEILLLNRASNGDFSVYSYAIMTHHTTPLYHQSIDGSGSLRLPCDTDIDRPFLLSMIGKICADFSMLSQACDAANKYLVERNAFVLDSCGISINRNEWVFASFFGFFLFVPV